MKLPAPLRLPSLVLWTVVGGVAFSLGSPVVRAQPLPELPAAEPTSTPTPTPVREPAEEAPDSPQASVRAFLDLCAQRRHVEAARHLTLGPQQRGRGTELARRLCAVLDRHLSVDLAAVSSLAEGEQDDGLPLATESLGTVPAPRGGQDAVYLVRAQDDSGYYWAFSRLTVARIDGWYGALEDRWIRESLPGLMLRAGPRGLAFWQWLALPVLGLLSWLLGRLLGTATKTLLHRLTRHTPTEWDERLLQRTARALTLLWAVAAGTLLLPWLALPAGAATFVRSVLSGGAALAVFWALWRSVDVVVQMLLGRPWAAGSPSTISLLTVSGNLVKAFVAVGGVVTTVGALGYPVATVLAGLGIGGIALAFGAQKTVENLFGSVALATDQPFRVGDFVRIDDFQGTVERIGLRSTQIRTLDRTLVSLPNGSLSEKRVESFAARDRVRLACTVGLVYRTTHEQMSRVLEGLERTLRAHPRIWPDQVVVRLAAFGTCSLDVEVMAWFQTTDYDEFRRCRQEVLLDFLRVVEEAGTSLAFPTRTVHLAGGPAGQLHPAS